MCRRSKLPTVVRQQKGQIRQKIEVQKIDLGKLGFPIVKVSIRGWAWDSPFVSAMGRLIVSER